MARDPISKPQMKSPSRQPSEGRTQSSESPESSEPTSSSGWRAIGSNGESLSLDEWAEDFGNNVREGLARIKADRARLVAQGVPLLEAGERARQMERERVEGAAPPAPNAPTTGTLQQK